jgi:UDP-N-acetylmuramate--alanine ligase
LLFAARGVEVGGHDRADSAFVEILGKAGVDVQVGESDAALLPDDVDLVVRSAAVAEDDPQLVEAHRRGIEVWKYAECLARLSPARSTIAVAGTHGKTTTAWLAYCALRGAAEGAARTGTPSALPGALIGGNCQTLGVNAVAPEDGGWFVVEACEYDRTFLQLAPEGAIVTNVEPDHLDYYGTYEALEVAFARFVDRVHPEGLLVVGSQVPEVVESQSACPVWRLGRELDIELTGETLGRFRFRLRGPGWKTPEIEMPIPGEHNVENAALALALTIGLAGRDEDSAADAIAGLSACAVDGLMAFKGVERRFEHWGRAGEIDVVHDYAHHPTEIRATLEAARRALPGRPLHVLFQPHQHSRTARFLEAFVDSLRSVDRVVISDVYGARKHIDELRGAGADELAIRLRKAGVDATYGGELWRSVGELLAGLPARSAALILGAGDVDRIQYDFLDQLALRGPRPSGVIV